MNWIIEKVADVCFPLMGVLLVAACGWAIYDGISGINDRGRQRQASYQMVTVKWVRVAPGSIDYQTDKGIPVTTRFMGPPQKFIVRYQEAALGEPMWIEHWFFTPKGEPANTIHYYMIHVPAGYPLTAPNPNLE
jgi:hypothetical protein